MTSLYILQRVWYDKNEHSVNITWYDSDIQAFMDSEKTINDFKKFIKENRDRLYDRSVSASDIPVNDEWMQENKWDEIYKREKQINGKI